jgi:glutathione peroxidase
MALWECCTRAARCLPMATAKSLYELSFINNRGESVALSNFQGRPVLIVNTASKCGLTPQYEGLQALHEQFSPRGLVVLGFPCDQFAGQEPGADAEIAEFCQINYGVTFGLSTKVDVNGASTHPVFVFLKGKTKGLLGGTIKWNFTKFLISADGTTVKRYAPTTVPAELEADIEAMLPAA